MKILHFTVFVVVDRKTLVGIFLVAIVVVVDVEALTTVEAK